MLISINKNVSSDKQDFPFLSFTQKSDYHAKSPKPTTIDLLSVNVGFAKAKTKLFHLIWLYCIDLAIKIDEHICQVLAKLC